MSEPIRLSKRLAELLPCSRREAELYIEGGWVTVDGMPVEEPQFKVEAQRIELLPGAVPEPLPPMTLLLNKPVGCSVEEALALLNAEHRWSDDPCQQRVLRKHFRQQRPTTPLEDGASGLLVFTQNYGVTRKLMDDAARVEHEYVVEVSGGLDANALKKMTQGLPLKASWQSENRLRIAGKQVRPGLIGKLCRDAGLRVDSIRRIRLGGVAMAKLPLGQWRYLQPGERF
ncbi:RNA pseudouridine synthase [Pseudomonas sp. ZM23]|uniref:Dual-specificity RNA pseudouridine synthase RluF n=1 Tax=Pseudomonas triclosanedens TaxID=2961893 RepID=A0ABY7A309_9PSED|nr:RNA pseudouridine synthase [Pseudomonas triclosanedens]MCP8464914.1 RNA pseudouridine synthase [Pseudomonas triclosanedens]MCP8470374.1 RNA pseudouridine synthase [Pseudomonas triclosanedens]MCP8476179.1 RNA pseudouridine synthase [Pseudomonas triclosanedens]WAI51587.1 RNA pseudouridine synthase [Pseudomonas triclosanedens]